MPASGRDLLRRFDRTIVRVHCFRLKGAPDEMFHRAVRFLTTLGSPASMIFSDDVEMQIERLLDESLEKKLSQSASLGRARRIDGVHDVHRGEALSLERRRIDIDAHEALLSAVGERRRGAGHGSKLRADKIVTEIEKLLLAERVAGQADLNDRHGRRRIDDHQGRSGSLREKPQECL